MVVMSPSRPLGPTPLGSQALRLIRLDGVGLPLELFGLKPWARPFVLPRSVQNVSCEEPADIRGTEYNFDSARGGGHRSPAEYCIFCTPQPDHARDYGRDCGTDYDGIVPHTAREMRRHEYQSCWQQSRPLEMRPHEYQSGWQQSVPSTLDMP